jgi:hypothetical protein
VSDKVQHTVQFDPCSAPTLEMKQRNVVAVLLSDYCLAVQFLEGLFITCV